MIARGMETYSERICPQLSLFFAKSGVLMSLFCGQIVLAPSDDARQSPENDLYVMAAAIEKKGVGPGTHLHGANIHVFTKCLTKDCVPQAEARLLVDPTSAVTCVGSVRIDNRQALTAQLNLPLMGCDRSDDLALVIAAYARWGMDCIAHLYGDFSFVLWDPALQTALCGRDHVGVVPFFFSQDGNRLLFSNDLACIAALKDIKTDLKRRNVADYLDTEVVMAVGQTFLTSVSRLIAGHQICFNADGLLQARWWHLDRLPKIQLPSDEAYIDALDTLLANAVRDRLPEDGAIATHVTGGLDSSTVTGLLAAACDATGRAPPHAFTWNPEPTSGQDAEHPEAAMLAAFCAAQGLHIHRHPPDEAGTLEYFTRDPVTEPPSNMLMMEIPVQRAAQALGCSTIFSGHGGDQGISYRGNGYIFSLLLQGDFRRLNAVAKGQKITPLRVYVSAVKLGYKALVFRMRNALPFVLFPARKSFKRAGFFRTNPRRRFNRPIGTSIEGARRAMLLDGYLDMRIEAWAEHGSRRALRYAYPLLDRRVLEFALGLPPEAYIRGAQTRWLIRQVVRRYAPDVVAYNTNKTEPTRSRAYIEAWEQVRPRLTKALEGRFTRDYMVDVARLRHSMATVPFARRNKDNTHFGRRRAALEMLDIDLTDE